MIWLASKQREAKGREGKGRTRTRTHLAGSHRKREVVNGILASGREVEPEVGLHIARACRVERLLLGHKLHRLLSAAERRRGATRGLDLLDLEVDLSRHALAPDGDRLHVLQRVLGRAVLLVVLARLDLVARSIIPVVAEGGERERHRAELPYWRVEVCLVPVGEELASGGVGVAEGDAVPLVGFARADCELQRRALARIGEAL